MAVAGLQNVSAFGPSFFGESQSPVSGRWDDDCGQPSTRASSLLQMWRELEGEHVVSQSYRSRQQRNGSDSECLSTTTSLGRGSVNGDDISQVSDESESQGFTGSETEHEDNHSIISEQSSDLGETERERVRQIFREWMNSSSKGHSSYGFGINNRSGQWLGENECERVRIIREWVQMTTQQRNDCGSLRDGVAEVGSQIEQVRDGLAITHPEIGARRPIRRLCGRQTLLDLLLRAQGERKRELLDLSEQRPVSDFAHRNRIQALLRGRFLRNQDVVLDERPSSVAATELGLLRQRHTVSDLREGFISRLDSSASTSVNSTESDSYLDYEVNGEPESACMEQEVTEICTTSGSESAADGNRSQEELEVQVTEEEYPVFDNEGSEQELSFGVESAGSREELALGTGARQQEVLSDVVSSGSRHGEQISSTTDQSTLESANYSQALEVHNDSYEPRTAAIYVREESDFQGASAQTNEESEFQVASAPVEEFQEPVLEIEDSGWEQLNTVASTEWADGTGDETARSWHESAVNQWFVETEISDNNVDVQDQMQESHGEWPSPDLQEAIDSWLDMPSGDIGAAGGGIDTFYSRDDDNVHSMELRELFSRRRVSSLLRSSFRESLNQVLQSHAERLGRASGDWEPDDTSSPPLIEQDQEQLNDDQTSTLSDGAERNPFAPSSTFFTAQPPWDEELQSTIWPHHNSNQQLGTEWEVINELRIDMARLQQRMNNMQSMLEACMDMQIELQRSVRQEVSAALNRSVFSRDEAQDDWLHDESQWEHVRKGICCLCRDSKIDSLLYRCGHMCTCSNCAEDLVQQRLKCPMCGAPVVELVRAYFIH
ncbi:hypothetical protein Salat_0458300 [Sesamum alatum]|uniref:RING-type domain-containing protein n=1 Tax=Sesamum alatum TaxID=300844 RepID=A0AAE1Z3Q6_9LAMI|nr:hypothetical protein Salat_0458300 [Sesamum alatum]